MFASFALTAILASASLLRVRADVTPSDPGPGVVYKAGGTCHIGWVGDKEDATLWKNMAIQLMTGENLNMIHLTTVATGLDGTVDGTFDHICPSVTPNAAIYFYQFTSNAPTKEWTTRFTIASSTGATTAPANDTQPNGTPIPWGIGALTDPSTAVPPPPSAAVATGGTTISLGALTSAAASGSAPLGSSTSAVVVPTNLPSSPVSLATVTPASSGLHTVLSVSAAGAAPSAAVSASANSTTNTKDNAGVAVGVDSRVWKAMVALGASTIAFAVLL